MGYVEFRDIQDSRTHRIRIESESDCRASEIMLNDTKLEPISWELKIGNPISNVCLGVWVCGRCR